MDKYGYVPEDEDEGVKTAAAKGKCPICGSDLAGNPPVCPIHGSAPFEKKNDGEEA